MDYKINIYLIIFLYFLNLINHCIICIIFNIKFYWYLDDVISANVI